METTIERISSKDIRIKSTTVIRDTLMVNNKKVYLRDNKLTRHSANKLSEEEIKCVYWFITNPLHIQSSVIETSLEIK